MTVLTEEYRTCPKCDAESGDDWSQCEGSCPMEMSPHYDSDIILGVNDDTDIISVETTTELGWLYDQIFDANLKRSTRTLMRRAGKMGEEYGEFWEAFLNVTSLHNGKNKTWEDVREELVDMVIVSIDLVATRLPTDEGKTEEEMREEIITMVNKKLAKWKVSNTAKTDAVSEERSRDGKI